MKKDRNATPFPNIQKKPSGPKIMIAIPCMSTLPTKFLWALECMHRLPNTYTSILENSLIHDARNEFVTIAISNNVDRVMWLDSDMTFEPDTLIKMSKHLDSGKEMVTGLCFKRVIPTEPVIYKAFHEEHEPSFHYRPEKYLDYPKDAVFQIAGCGFACCMTSTNLLKDIWDKYGPPFSFTGNIGEDQSFCLRATQMDRKIWCDSTIKVGHIGQIVIGESTWLAQQNAIPSATASGQSGQNHPGQKPSTQNRG